VKKFTAFCILALSLGLSIRPFSGFAQSSSGPGRGGTPAQASPGGTNPSLGFDTSEFPLWAKDLRRAEIVAFGSLPFTMLFTTFAVDTWRCYSHDWDPLYAPWPAKPPGAINMTQDELTMTMAVAAAVSVVLAITDFSILQIKRYKEKQRAKNLPPGSPIKITRKSAAESGPETAAGPEPAAKPELVPEAEPEAAAEPAAGTEPAVKAAQPVPVPQLSP
jgi:hypothetical protein